jgi:hypothetical protein
VAQDGDRNLQRLRAQRSLTMRRTAIAAAWLLGATIPLAASAVLVFGCCVLPFHKVIHKAMPMCERAVDLLRGEHAGHHGGAEQSVPASQKQEPVKRMATTLPRPLQLVLSADGRRAVSQIAATSYRSSISLGAIRCDQDVGLHLLIATLLI